MTQSDVPILGVEPPANFSQHSVGAAATKAAAAQRSSAQHAAQHSASEEPGTATPPDVPSVSVIVVQLPVVGRGGKRASVVLKGATGSPDAASTRGIAEG